MPAKILVVDDEISIRRLLRNTLERAGYAVVEAVDARSAIACAAAEHPSAILLDLGLPDRDGLSLIPVLRRDGDAVILVVSARDATDEKVAALDLGADDFVTKPFDSDELLARLRVALRHRASADTAPKLVRKGGLTIDLDRRVVTRDGEELHLTRKEHEVLAVLARHSGRVVTHDKIIAAAWGGDEDPRIEYLRIVIRNLRQKLEAPDPVGSVIANELGVGYRLRTDS
ncbi:winged helix family two component transcriptional regulator [Sphingomonas sp. PP-CE-3A-406]|uniref:response regulator transcription factor n=1 Tax=Sphingomonas sp. PP-CE-3A-406 TaxID=2135659 RepID=UPI000EF9EB4A|nr:response regulator transcription factor [Sphingomonas sp. PP-CE-3A-406]RMB52185.1 winged helix family two component transcriptional regulator [Sphingomonas sp. PP-CE-3A-406]